MKNYIIVRRNDRMSGEVVEVSNGRKNDSGRRKLASKGKELEKRLGELAGRYAVVMQFANDQEAKQYARDAQEAARADAEAYAAS